MPDSGPTPFVFAGLPSQLVGEIVSECPSLADQAAGTVKAFIEARDGMRGGLEEKDLLGRIGNETPPSPSVCGIDGCYGVEQALSSDIGWCALFGAEGLTEGGALWESPVHRVDILADEPSRDTMPLLAGILSQRFAETAASAPHGIVLAGYTLARLFAMMMDGLQPAMRSRNTKTAKMFVAGLKTALAAFDTIAGDSPEHVVTGMTRGGYGAADGFLGIPGMKASFRRDILFTVLLNPGEYAGPAASDSGVLDAARNLAIKDPSFASLRDRIAERLSGRRVVWFRPRDWTPALMLDVPASDADDKGRLENLLAGIMMQCATPGTTVPFPLYLAGQAASAFGRAAPAVRNTIISSVAESFGDRLGDILPFMQANESIMGDDHE